jgi:hypothetical protein
MTRTGRALVVSAVATGSLAALWYLWKRWNVRVEGTHGPRTPEDAIDELSERQQNELLAELREHV